jgi:hypothetical protein
MDREIMNRLIEVEDAAREIRHRMKHRDTAVYPSDISDLASAVVGLAQTVRDMK